MPPIVEKALEIRKAKNGFIINTPESSHPGGPQGPMWRETVFPNSAEALRFTLEYFGTPKEMDITIMTEGKQ